MTHRKAEIQNFLDLIVRTKDEYVSISLNLDNWKIYTNGTDCFESDTQCGKPKSLLLQVFIYEKEKIAEWNALKRDNDIDGLKKLTAKDNDGISKWGIVDIVISEQNCDFLEIDRSSTDVVNDYRQLLLQDKNATIFIELSCFSFEYCYVFEVRPYVLVFLLQVPQGLTQFNITDDDFKIMGHDFIGVTCNQIQSFIASQLNQSQVQHGNQTSDLESMYQRYFRCGFKETFSGALRRVFSGMNAVQNYEVTMMRKYESDNDISLCRTGNVNCYIAEFSLQSK